jgi:hypothetical protein
MSFVVQECYEGVTRVLRGCYKSVTRVLQVCYEGVTRVYFFLVMAGSNIRVMLYTSSVTSSCTGGKCYKGVGVVSSLQ